MSNAGNADAEDRNSGDVRQGKESFVGVVASAHRTVWDKKVEGTQLSKFQEIIETKYGIRFGSYWDLHKWSVENYAIFWEELWHFYEVISSQPYEEVVRTGESLIDTDWFPGARLNYAENMLRYRDDHVALICVDEEGREEKITYEEMYEKVKLYAAAFRKHGLTLGDRIACYLPNRKEAVFAMLAGASIGAIWGGPLPLYGPKATSIMIRMMSPKFLFTVDRFTYHGREKRIFEDLPSIVKGTSSIEKVIIAPCEENSLSLDISVVEKSCFLHEFLAKGRNIDGSLPDLIFEQLPFNHPLILDFTSGTTGPPKGIVHSAGAYLPLLRNFGLHYNFSRGDVILATTPVGCNLWIRQIACLSLGSTLLLFNGFPFYLLRHAFWDVMDKYNVSYIYFVPKIVDMMEKTNNVPSPGCKLKHLKMVGIGSSPVKPQNIEFLLEKVKSDIFIACVYGSTEFIGVHSGCDFNSPAYAAEIQGPALGVDLRCLDGDGNSVVGQIGEMVIASPAPSLPLFIWNDDNNKSLQERYLSKYPGFWTQNDRCWINPKTRGIIMIGRSDEALNPYSLTFGSADIYFAIHDLKDIVDSLCVPQYSTTGDQRAVLFVKMAEGYSFTSTFAERVQKCIAEELTILHMPEIVLEAPDIPYNLNNKKMERLVMNIIKENKVPEVWNIRNPECLDFFCNIPELQKY